MDAVVSQEEETLRSQVRQAREGLDGLVRDLRAVDGELDGLSTERHQHRLLSDACDALEELEEKGAAGLFWSGHVADSEGAAHLRLVRGRVGTFERQVRGVEERRQALLEELERQEENTVFLEDELFDAQQREEERKNEWIIEREIDPLPVRELVMPWTRGGEEDERFRRALAASLLLSLLLALILPLIDLPVPERWETIEIPDRLTRLIQENRPLPPPPPVQEQARPEKEPEELVAEEATSKPAKEPEPKSRARSKGILAFREKFSGLADSQAADRLGAKARITRSGEAASGRPTRSMVATQAPGSSGGINLSALSRDVGGGGGEIEGVQVVRATSSIGGGTGSDRPSSRGGASLGRSDEEIQIVFDRHKAALYRLYNRELRKDPTLMGQMVLRIRIEPDGSVSLSELVSSDMKAPRLSAQVVERVKTFDFGAKEGIPAITILYPIDFLPAA